MLDRKLALALAVVEERDHDHALAVERHEGGLRMVCRCGWVGPVRRIATHDGLLWLRIVLADDADNHAHDAPLWEDVAC